MKKFARLLGGLILPMFAVGCLMAAQVCNKTDMWCYESGPSQNLTTVGRLDASGNLTTNGTITATGAITSISSITAVGATYTPGGLVNPSTTQFSSTNFTNLFATNTLPAVATFETFTASGALNLLMTSLPTIATTTITSANYLAGVQTVATNIPDGTYLIVGTTGTAKFFIQDNASLAGSDLALGTAGSEVISSSRPVVLIFQAANGLWTQISKYNGGF